jgi:aspartate carbamoyltransferase catalytic subunit
MAKSKHFLSIKDISKNQIEQLVEKTCEKNFCHYDNKFQMVKFFLEPSTRTTLSFEMAAHKLGVESLSFDVDHSSLKKGEHFIDTFETIEAMGAKFIVVRSKKNFLTQEFLDNTSCSIINGGLGSFEHPSQALLDAVTIYKNFSRLDNLHISFIGDTAYSRVAQSNIDLLSKFNNTLSIVSPGDYQLKRDEVDSYLSLDEAIKVSDVIMILRPQNERHSVNSEVQWSEWEKYRVDENHLNQLKQDGILMHPGPVNRDFELTIKAMKHSKSRILDQVANGVWTRMSIFNYLTEDL